jgi:hypothetical protein
MVQIPSSPSGVLVNKVLKDEFKEASGSVECQCRPVARAWCPAPVWWLYSMLPARKAVSVPLRSPGGRGAGHHHACAHHAFTRPSGTLNAARGAAHQGAAPPLSGTLNAARIMSGTLNAAHHQGAAPPLSQVRSLPSRRPSGSLHSSTYCLCASV